MVDLKKIACITINPKIEAVLSRNVKIHYLLSLDMRYLSQKDQLRTVPHLVLPPREVRRPR